MPLTIDIPENATAIREGDKLIGHVWRGEDGSGPWPGEVWELVSIHHGETVSIRRTEADAVRYVHQVRETFTRRGWSR